MPPLRRPKGDVAAGHGSSKGVIEESSNPHPALIAAMRKPRPVALGPLPRVSAAYLAAQRLGLIGTLVSSIAQNGIDQMKSAETAPGTSCTGTCGSAAGAQGPPMLVVQYHSP